MAGIASGWPTARRSAGGHAPRAVPDGVRGAGAAGVPADVRGPAGAGSGGPVGDAGAVDGDHRPVRGWRAVGDVAAGRRPAAIGRLAGGLRAEPGVVEPDEQGRAGPGDGGGPAVAGYRVRPRAGEGVAGGRVRGDTGGPGKRLALWRDFGGSVTRTGELVEEPAELRRARLILGLCDRFRCLPGQLKGEDAEVLRLIAVEQA